MAKKKDFFDKKHISGRSNRPFWLLIMLPAFVVMIGVLFGFLYQGTYLANDAYISLSVETTKLVIDVTGYMLLFSLLGVGAMMVLMVAILQRYQWMMTLTEMEIKTMKVKAGRYEGGLSMLDSVLSCTGKLNYQQANRLMRFIAKLEKNPKGLFTR